MNPLKRHHNISGKRDKRIVVFLRNSAAFSIRQLRKVVLPGFDGIPLFTVLIFFFQGLFEGKLTLRASAVSYNFFLALFPTILFFFTIIPFVPIRDFQPTLLTALQEVIPATLWWHVSSTLTEIITRPRSDLLSIGFILALYFSTNGIASIIEGFNSTVHAIETRSWLKQRLVSLFLLVVISVLIIILISLSIIGGYIIRWLMNEGILTDFFTILMIQVLRWILIVSLFLFTNSFLYYFAPARRREFRFISAGSTLTTILLILTTYGFNFYIDNFNRYNALYGSIGTLLVFMLWIYFNSIIVLIGFELNASIRMAKGDITAASEAEALGHS
ncbi:MAG: YihY/virulence factor BrkB family protein [Bacteroidales bacterium]|nr:YihY/virulence factor BrkB family protein [Bacteroidales bacterium]MDD3527321.1 YihY/virulence factor BrkB family protein [Bacteroidales bacterium]MDD4176327.1 YihY/virulence factor BrkB family protein [Bacteroidales bacterium]MDD4741132.1 YihY/virulence factor BrkB family protein [Bacteroidales bacterium]MDY0334364.1 YihY/virulence factor BrkB family protein [Bacteroidales bacterium]